MNIRNRLTALLPALLFAVSCEDNSEVFYSTTYTIERIEVQVTVSEPEPEPEPENPEVPDPENPDPVNPDPETPAAEACKAAHPSLPHAIRDHYRESNGTREGEQTPENPLIGTIVDDALAHAPMQAGGSYTLDYTEHDGGLLRVVTAPGSESLSGRFEREPGAMAIRFIYSGKDYACSLGSYATERNESRAVLSIDLTAHYQVLYPDEKILQVRLRQYTSHPVF